MRCQMEKEARRLSLRNEPKQTPTLAEQYSRFIPVQVKQCYRRFEFPVRVVRVDAFFLGLT